VQNNRKIEIDWLFFNEETKRFIIDLIITL